MGLKDRIQTDLTTAMRARDSIRTSTLRMTLAAIREAEVAGKQARTLSEDEVEAILFREARKRREAAEAFASAGREESAQTERAEYDILAEYLPQQLSEDELSELVRRVLDAHGLAGQQAMGQAMKLVRAEVAGRAEGARVAAAVRAALGT